MMPIYKFYGWYHLSLYNKTYKKNIKYQKSGLLALKLEEKQSLNQNTRELKF